MKFALWLFEEFEEEKDKFEKFEFEECEEESLSLLSSLTMDNLFFYSLFEEDFWFS